MAHGWRLVHKVGHKAAIVIPAEYCSNIREVMEEATDRAAAVIFGDLAVMCAYLPHFFLQ